MSSVASKIAVEELKEVVPQGMPAPANPTAKEIQIIEQYVDQEIESRFVRQLGK